LSRTLGPGDIFGEEIIVGLAELYTFTTKAETFAKLEMITEKDFGDCFQTMPTVVARMRRNVQEQLRDPMLEGEGADNC